MKRFDWILTFTVHDVDPAVEKPLREIGKLTDALAKMGDGTSFRAEWKEKEKDSLRELN